MSGPRPTHSIESCAALAFLKGDSGAEQVAALVGDAESRVAMHKVTMLQLYCDIEGADDTDMAERAWDAAANAFVLDDTLDDQFVKRVARWRRDLGAPTSLAAAAALAEEHGAILIVHANEPRTSRLHELGIAVLNVGADQEIPPATATPPVEGASAT